jgi:hypothetical protein
MMGSIISNSMSEEDKYKPVKLEPTKAQCNCGAVKLTISNPRLVLACHCHDCRARTGADMALCLTSNGKDVKVEEAAGGQVVEFGKFHPDGSNKGPRVRFCKTCGTTTHYSSFGGAIIQVPLLLTGLKDKVDEPFFHMWKDSAVPTSKGIFERATVPVFDGLPTGKAMSDFMAIAKGE